MAAIHQDVVEHMEKQIAVMRDRMLALHPFSMTHEECLELVAPPEHHTILRDALSIAMVRSSADWMAVTAPGNGEVFLQMRTHGQKEPPLVPRSPRWHPCEPGERVIQWVQKRIEIGRQFAIARWVLQELADKCETGAQVRYLWPSVLLLCGGVCEGSIVADRVNRWKERNAAFKPQRSLPALSQGLKEDIRTTGAVLTAASMIDEIDTESDSETLIHLNAGDYTFNHHGFALTLM